ncbi:TIGR03086 family metal-binding protein [Actinomadura sp. 9N215]|uniref:TIGR03086 family metal-binding protein n=1 Tax=Actinomadura sp. 9N215 TaxID=3375150 RepID=UPI00378AF47F
MSTPPLALLDDCMAWADGVVEGIHAEQGSAATPCSEFTVDDLLAHLIDGLTWFGQLPAGGPTDPRRVHGLDPVGRSHVEAFHAARATIRRNWTPAHLSDTYALPFGQTTGTGITEYMSVETLGHGWDLAAATGQPITVAPHLAEAALTIARGLEPALRAPGMMADAVTVTADTQPIDRFVAFLGRHPQAWTTPR